MKAAFVLGCALAAVLGCASNNTASAPSRYPSEDHRVVDAPRDNSSNSGANATDMRGGGRGGEHHIEKH
jgi:hypothetical protein